jgi:energy-coupling factor transporter ATP-binding protein EcfA2
MIHSLTIQGYQSVRKRTDLTLGRFTVVTGPTGSGKTSLIRALRLLAFNQRGTAYISHGAKEAVVCLAFPVPGDHPYCAVAITRGSRGADKYTITAAPEDGDPSSREFTKLGGKVPDHIQGLLRLTDLNFAGQFDRPFLLDDSGSEVARVLGRLTNVTVIFEAAREGSRRKGEVARDLKRAEAEIERLKAEAARFTRLREHISSVESAEAALEAATLNDRRVQRLMDLTGLLRTAQAHSAAIVLPEPPDLAKLEELAARRELLAGRIRVIRSERLAVARCDQLARGHVIAEAQAGAEVSRLLREAGVCPTCGTTIGGDHGEHADRPG